MSNAIIDNIKTRRSIRAYTNVAVSEELIDAVTEAGTYAPTGRGAQSPVIVAVSGKEYRQRIAELNASVMGRTDDPYYGAPTVILVLADPEIRTWVEDGCCALQNMMLSAHSLGLGSVWVHREREIFDSEEGKSLLREWGLPTSLRGVGAIALGYPATTPNPPAPRKSDYVKKV